MIVVLLQVTDTGSEVLNAVWVIPFMLALLAVMGGWSLFKRWRH